jgi:hypothetical protein
VVDQLGNTEPLFRVLGKTSQYEVLDFWGGRFAAGKIDVVIDHFRKIVFCPNLEGHLAIE